MSTDFGEEESTPSRRYAQQLQRRRAHSRVSQRLRRGALTELFFRRSAVFAERSTGIPDGDPIEERSE